MCTVRSPSSSVRVHVAVRGIKCTTSDGETSRPSCDGFKKDPVSAGSFQISSNAGNHAPPNSAQNESGTSVPFDDVVVSTVVVCCSPDPRLITR